MNCLAGWRLATVCGSKGDENTSGLHGHTWQGLQRRTASKTARAGVVRITVDIRAITTFFPTGCGAHSPKSRHSKLTGEPL